MGGKGVRGIEGRDGKGRGRRGGVREGGGRRRTCFVDSRGDRRCCSRPTLRGHDKS